MKRYFHYPYTFHGKAGIYRRLPKPQTRPMSRKTVDFLASHLRGRPGQITLVALGPLTNLAHLQRRHPGTLEMARTVVIMGGAVDVPGNITPLAEFNFYSDPQAAQEIVSSNLPLTLVDLGACRRVSITRRAMERVSSKHRLGILVVQLLNNWFRKHPGQDRFEFYDPLAVVAALDTLILQTKQVSKEVSTTGQIHLGESLVTVEGGNMAVVREVGDARFITYMAETLGLKGLAI